MEHEMTEAEKQELWDEQRSEWRAVMKQEALEEARDRREFEAAEKEEEERREDQMAREREKGPLELTADAWAKAMPLCASSEQASEAAETQELNDHFTSKGETR